MFKPIRWPSFPRDFAVAQLGFILFGLSIALLIQANLGTSPWVVLTVALTSLTGLSVGTLTVVIGMVVLVGALLMRERIGWGTLSNILFIGPWVDVFLRVFPPVHDNLPLQSAFLLIAIFLMGLATAIYISVDAGAGPRDSLMLALERTTGLSLRMARALLEITVVLVGGLLGGPLGVGTLVFALLIGPAVQWAFRLFKVPSHRSAKREPAPVKA